MSPFKGDKGQADEDAEMSDSASSKRRREEGAEDPPLSDPAEVGTEASNPLPTSPDNYEDPPGNQVAREDDQPMEHDQVDPAEAIAEDIPLTWDDTFSGSKEVILEVSKRFKAAAKNLELEAVTPELDLHELVLRTSGGCLFDGNLKIEGPTLKFQVSRTFHFRFQHKVCHKLQAFMLKQEVVLSKLSQRTLASVDQSIANKRDKLFFPRGLSNAPFLALPRVPPLQLPRGT